MSVELVEVVRSGVRECVHRGSVVVSRVDGEPTLTLGETHTPIYPRSANKPLQAVALLRNGFVPQSTEELAIATASHSGESDHIELVERILGRYGLTADLLRCPAELPLDELARAELLAAGELPQPIYMGCSGKHAAMLATCVVNDWPLDSYLEPSHPLQKAVVATFAAISGEADPELGIDGCGLPIVPLSLTHLARLYSTLVTAEPDSPERAVADSAREHPHLLSGTGRSEARLMPTVPGLFCKSGADGIYAGALPDGSAFAVKIEDGHERALLPVAAALAHHMGAVWTEDLAALASLPVLGGGVRVGTIRAIPGIF
ncbi:asparaginase [Rhodococcus sp. NPDC058521]|uniref:asparaginase n=1 Tax=Rhodococcus sp. NPDC058521 TaxID=3346536 RepID=UPI003648EA1F